MILRNDILLGKQEIDCEPQHGSSSRILPCVWLSILHIEIDIVFGRDDGYSMEVTTLFLTITESANRNSSLNAAVNTTSPITVDLDGPAAEGGATPLAVQRKCETMQTIPVTSLPPSLRTGDLPRESDTPPVQPEVGSQPETSSTALRRAEEAINNINTIGTWRSAVTNIKRVMDIVAPIVAVCLKSFLPIRP
jgi:hypothetical protein